MNFHKKKGTEKQMQAESHWTEMQLTILWYPLWGALLDRGYRMGQGRGTG